MTVLFVLDVTVTKRSVVQAIAHSAVLCICTATESSRTLLDVSTYIAVLQECDNCCTMLLDVNVLHCMYVCVV